MKQKNEWIEKRKNGDETYHINDEGEIVGDLDEQALALELPQEKQSRSQLHALFNLLLILGLVGTLAFTFGFLAHSQSSGAAQVGIGPDHLTATPVPANVAYSTGFGSIEPSSILDIAMGLMPIGIQITVVMGSILFTLKILGWVTEQIGR